MKAGEDLVLSSLLFVKPSSSHLQKGLFYSAGSVWRIHNEVIGTSWPKLWNQSFSKTDSLLATNKLEIRKGVKELGEIASVNFLREKSHENTSTKTGLSKQICHVLKNPKKLP